MSRVSNRGNPWHYPKGHPRGGQFAPKGYAQAAASVNGMYFRDRASFDEYKESMRYEQDSKEFYGNRTRERFSQPPSEEQVKFAKQIEKKTGVPMPENATTRDVEEYICENYAEFAAASEGQARLIRNLEEEMGVDLASDDRYGGHAGGYIGHMKKAEKLLDKDNWEKHEDGCYYCITHDPSKTTGKPGTQHMNYRLRPVRVDGKTRYMVERGEKNSVKGPTGEKVEETTWFPIDKDKTGTKALVKDGLEAARKRAALNETRRFQKKYKQERKGRKRRPEGIAKTVEDMKRMDNPTEWKANDDGTYTFATVYDRNNSYEYVVEKGTTGYHAFRKVNSTQSMRKYNKQTGQMMPHKKEHSRDEWVLTGYNTPEEAMAACQKWEAKTIYDQRIDLKAASPEEIERWTAEGRITSKTQYMRMMDEVRAVAKK